MNQVYDAEVDGCTDLQIAREKDKPTKLVSQKRPNSIETEKHMNMSVDEAKEMWQDRGKVDLQSLITYSSGRKK